MGERIVPMVGSSSFTRASPALGSCWTALRYSMTASAILPDDKYLSPLAKYFCLATRGSVRQAASADQRAAITIWVWMVCASSRPDASVTRVCHTIVVRPR